MYRSIPVYLCLFGFFLNLQAPEALASNEPNRYACTESTKINQFLLDRVIIRKLTIRKYHTEVYANMPKRLLIPPGCSKTTIHIEAKFSYVRPIGASDSILLQSAKRISIFKINFRLSAGSSRIFIASDK